MKRIPIERLRALLANALQAGGRRLTLYRTEWNISGDCSDPYHSELWGRPMSVLGQYDRLIKPGVNTPQILEIWTRCRRCNNCLRMRARRWYGAAIAETKASSRTWFGTLTLSPENHYVMLSRARAKLAKQGIDYDQMSEHDRFLMRHSQTGIELTKYIKRIRKNSGAALRYLLVAEAHKSGLPHYHMLVHERPLGGTIPHRILSEGWQLGFEKWRLSDAHNPRASAYLCKYLSKSLSARVRASQRYGGATSELHTYVSTMLKAVGQEGIFDAESGEEIDPPFSLLKF